MDADREEEARDRARVVDGIRNATVEELQKVGGMTRRAAEQVKASL